MYGHAILLSLLIVCGSAFAGELQFTNVQAQEAGDSFSLQVSVKSQEDSDYEYHRNATASTYDSVDLYNYIRVSPAVKFSVSAKRNGFMLVGDFKPETNYKVSLKAGLASREGNRLKADSEKDVRTSSFRPRFSFKTKSRYLPGSLQGNLNWEAVNIDRVEFEVRQVYPQNLHQWLSQSEHTNDYVSEPVKTVAVKVGGKKNKTAKGTFSLKDLEALGQGVFVVSAKPPSKKTEEQSVAAENSGESEGESEGGEETFSDYRHYGDYDHARLVVTNLTVVAKRGQGQVKVWVMGTRDLSPVKDAQVDLINTSNRKLDSCRTTGGSAECTLSWKKQDSAKPYALVVKAGKDMTYVRFEDLTLPNDTFHAGKRDFGGSTGGLDAYIYPERDLYRPGETVKLAAMVRNQKFEAVGKLPLRWTVTSPRGKVVRESVSDTSDLGIAKMEYASSPASDTGRYMISVTAGKTVLHQTSLLIEEFVPERIGMKVLPQSEVNVGKAAVGFNISANYLFGPPVAGGAYKISCSMKPAFTQIPNRPGYATGLYSKNEKQAVTLEAKEGKLSDKGAVTDSCALQTAGGKMTEAFEMKARVEVNEAGGGRATVKTGSAFVAGTDTLIGLKMEGSSGRQIKVRGGLFDFKGQVKNAKATLKVKLFNMREHWYYSYGGYDSWTAEEIISPAGVEKTIEGSGSFDFTVDAPEGWGRWLVRVEDTKTGYTADLDAGYIGWYYSDRGGRNNGLRAPEPNALKIELSKTEVSPGDKIQAMITAPFAGRVLFSFETDKTLETQWVKVDKPGQIKVDLKVPDALPNVYLTALLLKDPVEAGGKRFLPARAFGAASLRVIPAAHQLDVKVTHPEISESRKPVTIEIANSAKSAAEYSVAVVDEGILQMTSFQSPDPLKRFFEARALGVGSAETLGWTVAMDGPAGKTPGGDADAKGAAKNMPVKLVSFWFPSVKSDSSGKAQVQLTLPAFQGKVRVMAVASGKSRMGSSSGEMTVRDPLVLQSTLPRFLTQGDKFQFPVSVMNLSGKDQTVNVEAASGPMVAVAAPKQSAKIANGQTKVFSFEADVRGVQGQASFKITAVSADGKLNSVENFDLPVKPSGVEQTIRLSLDSNKDVVLASHFPADWRTDYSRVEASVSSLPYLNQMSEFEQMIHYPYGCIEQTTSGTLPLLTMTDLLQWVDSKKGNKANIKDMVNKGIARVFSMQTASGGFGYWPGDGEASPWGTAYATFMLLEAKKLGYDVNAGGLKSALDYLEGYTRRTSYTLASTAPRYDDAAEPFVLYVLAKGGRSVTQELRDTLRTWKQASTPKGGYHGIAGENYFLLASTAKILGDKDSMKKLADESAFSAQLAGKNEDEFTYWSSMRSDGLRLAVLLDISPNSPAADVLVQRVAANLSRKGAYYSTQDVGWSVLALGKRISGIKKVDNATLSKVSLAVNGKGLTKSFDVAGAPGFAFDGPALNKATVKVLNVPAERGVYLYVKATGYTKSPPKSKSGLSIQRMYYTREGTGLSPSSIKQGDTVFVHLLVQNKSPDKVNNIAIVDHLPGGFEIENPRLGKNEDLQWMNDAYKADYQDLRDDRVQVFGDLKPRETVSVYYSARAVTKGRFTAPAAFVEAMYDPANFAYDTDTPVQIVDAVAKK